MSGSRSTRPAPPAALGEERAAALDALVEEALRDQRRNVARGLEGALDRVPRVLRGPIRRVTGA